MKYGPVEFKKETVGEIKKGFCGISTIWRFSSVTQSVRVGFSGSFRLLRKAPRRFFLLPMSAKGGKLNWRRPSCVYKLFS